MECVLAVLLVNSRPTVTLTLVAEGIDGASHSGADFGPDAILGPAASDELWLLAPAARAVTDAGWGGVTVDAFAFESNARAPRFWSRFHEPGGYRRAVVPDWARSACPPAAPPTVRCCSPFL